ncbi:MAG: bifunctional riboflavin kinase/FAD synthetase [Dehalococcoidia bacterium]|nr:bifunctional riboflavin kinase/FAD synthetase [Dehalococcoidia bacterium]
MKALEELSAIRPGHDTAIIVGVFDGVHLGHQHLLRQLRARARELHLQSTVVTFKNHPREVLHPEMDVPALSTLARRVSIMHTLGIELVVPLTFDLELSNLTARQFLDILYDKLRMRALVVGPDFALGHNREGTAPVLHTLGKDIGIHTSQVTPLLLDGRQISSTEIRRYLAEGDVVTAARYLGRPYCLEGRIVHGDRRGSDLGYPTTNLQVEPGTSIPKNGIYATWVSVKGKRYPSATSIGVRPTFGESLGRTIETFILDFSDDIYGQPMSLEFARRLRDELKFDSPEALISQIDRDVADTKIALSLSDWMLEMSPLRWRQ